MLVLAVVGAVTRGAGCRQAPNGFLGALSHRATSSIAAAIFSAIPYKTPWNLLPFYVGAIVARRHRVLDARPARPRPARCAARWRQCSSIASGQLGWQAWRASVTYASDPRNPYVYAQTVPDAVRMATRIRELAALHPDGARMQVSVIAPPHEQWPLPWYLRTMPHVGYWTAPGDALALQAPVIVASTDHTAVLDGALGDRYVSEFFGLRPEVLLALYVERGLWERFLARAALGGGAPECGDAGLHSVPALRTQHPLWHCGRRRACDDASRAGPGRALLQRGGPPRPRGVPAVRHDAPGRAARDGRRWEPGRHGGDPRAHARGGAGGGDDAATLAAPRQGRGGAGRHPRGAGAARGARRVLRRRPGDAARGQSTISWPCCATARTSSSCSARA